ncbi:MAG: hypothetical protein HY226_03445 [Candidatus Vogelbacteria bacterium]|nr:hypothetical protein [Candidatus Vogelbacteria bacterium]
MQACEEFIRSATKETTMEYVYGDGENQYVTRAPVPEPLEGYTVVVSQGMDHHGCEDEDFYAIPQGTTLVPRKDGVYLDHLHIKLQGEIIWVHFWEVAEVVFPSGSMELRQTEKGAPAGWVSLPNWREEQADS